MGTWNRWKNKFFFNFLKGKENLSLKCEKGGVFFVTLRTYILSYVERESKKGKINRNDFWQQIRTRWVTMTLKRASNEENDAKGRTVNAGGRNNKESFPEEESPPFHMRKHTYSLSHAHIHTHFISHTHFL